MEDMRIYALSAFALVTSMSPINPILQTIVLVLTIVYTSMGIYKRIKVKNDNK